MVRHRTEIFCRIARLLSANQQLSFLRSQSALKANALFLLCLDTKKECIALPFRLPQLYPINRYGRFGNCQ